MQQLLSGFDPLLFLNIDTSEIASPDEISRLRTDLIGKIGEYILIKLSDQLSSEELNQVLSSASGEEMLQTLDKLTPDLQKKIVYEIENFKIEYQKTTA